MGKFRLKKFAALRAAIFLPIMKENNGFCDVKAAAGENFELFELPVMISLVFCTILNVFEVRSNVGIFENFPHCPISMWENLKFSHIKCEKKNTAVSL